VRQWKSGRGGVAQAFVPLAFPPGETCQFDWSHEEVEPGGMPQTVKVAHFRLAFQPRMFVAAYPRETQERVFDAHARAFAFFGGVPARLVYDNLKTVVDLGLTGKERQSNRRFLALANHYLSGRRPAPRRRAGRRAKWGTRWATSASGCSRRG
jgi:transposase